MYRLLLHIGYKVRYVRNITDVGHLLDNGEDRVSKRAKLEKLEPMEIVQKYSNSFHAMMETFHTHKPSIEPRATQHIIEQIEMVQKIIDNGYAYEKNGSVYFDTIKFHEEKKSYGNLSGRIIEELMVETRDDLKNQSEKKHPSDFAIWMKAAPEHIMKWNSPWSVGFPGWHLECSVMSTKYLGEKFPHVTKGYTPMAVKFFMLQSHYSSTLDLTDAGLQASEKGYKKLMTSLSTLQGLETKDTSSELDQSINDLLEEFLVHMCDDFNTPRAIASLFEIVTKINSLKEGHLDINQLSKDTLDKLKKVYPEYITEVLGLPNDMDGGDNNILSGVMDLIIDLRQDARSEKNWAASDKIRDGLAKHNITIKDGKDGTTWNIS